MGTHQTTDEQYPLGPALDFMRNVAAMNRGLELLSSRMDRTLGITAQQRLVVRCIGKYPGITPGQLATILHIDPGTVSASLRRLVARRLVERRDDPRDRRRTVLGLTNNGREVDRPAAGTVEHAVERLLQETSADDIATVARVLTRLSSLLREVSEAERARTTDSAPAAG